MKEINTLEEMRSIELSIMKKVHQFCVEKKINYYLAYGTLIGTIRHNGFIPWDDDIDIVMPRSDYEKFCDLFPEEATNYSLQLVNHRTKPYYGRAMSKVIDVKTFLIEPEYNGDDPIGVFVDVWPLDGCYESPLLEKIHLKVCNLIQGLLYRKIDARHVHQKFVSRVFLSIFRGKLLVKLLECLIKQCNYDKSQKVRCYVDPYRVILNKTDFKPVLHQFEDAEFCIPIGYDAILRATYGDYMQLPPKDKQVPHHVVNTYWK